MRRLQCVNNRTCSNDCGAVSVVILSPIDQSGGLLIAMAIPIKNPQRSICYVLVSESELHEVALIV